MSEQLKIEILDFWHAGTGRGASVELDARVYRSTDGLPVLPGRTLRGLLRDAVRQAENLGWLDPFKNAAADTLADQFFGTRSQAEATGGTIPGVLRVGDARLPACTRAPLSQMLEDDRNPLVEMLFSQLHQTAINENGSARAGSLRAIEVAVPLTLFADIDLLPGQKPPENWKAILTTALPLLRAVGGHRNRGLGRCRCELQSAC
jgi:hypothetical protein